MALQVSSEMAFLMSRENVAEDVVNKLAAAGIVTVRNFANIVDSVDDLRKMAKEELEMAPDTLGGQVKDLCVDLRMESSAGAHRRSRQERCSGRASRQAKANRYKRV